MLIFVADENVPSQLVDAARRNHLVGGQLIDMVAVGEPGVPPQGTADPDLLDWAAANNRIVVSQDKKTMPGHLAAHLAAGKTSPGVLLVRANQTIPRIVAELELIAHAGAADDYRNQYDFIP